MLRCRMNHNVLLLLLLLLLTFCGTTVVTAVLPKYELQVQVDPKNGDTTTTTTTTTFLASHALFGALPEMANSNTHKKKKKNWMTLTSSKNMEDPNLCTSTSTSSTSSTSDKQFPLNSIVLVPRGSCTFETKASNAQQMGASAVLIYGTLASRYTLNTTTTTTNTNTSSDSSSIIWPLDQMDYDCTKGRALIPKHQLSFDPLPYDATTNDPVLSSSSPDGLCIQNSPNQLQTCESKRCLLTGKTINDNNDNNDNNEIMMEACCAWDLHIWLYPDTTTDVTNNNNNNTAQHPAVTIPTAYITMQEATELFQIMEQQNNNNNPKVVVSAMLYNRWRPFYNASAILIWLLGSAIAALAAYLTASEYHDFAEKVKKQRDAKENGNNNKNDNTNLVNSTSSSQQSQQSYPDEILELTPLHALGFVIMASTSLLVLFFFKIYGVVKIFYALGCSTAVSQVILLPLTAKIMKQLQIRNTIVWRTNTEEFGDITFLEMIAHAMGYALGIAWLYLAMTQHDPETIPFFWIMQDVFGACMCITFLKVIRLSSIRVASILLIVAFFYDIFFVFVSPLLFSGKSVMITVATSGGPPKADALWCEKYPDDADCQGGNPMPMLLAIPKINDYMGGSSLLGLGDIVLPGLLLSFAARFDAAKQLLGVLGGGRGAQSTSYNCPEQKYCLCTSILCRQGGYFPPLVVAYAIGLAMANTAVYVMNMGQPALLYLVPACLGTLGYVGWRRNELQELWDGPRVLKAADNVIYGYPVENGNHAATTTTMSPNHHHHHAPLPVVDDGTDAFTSIVPSASDDDNNHNNHVDLSLTQNNNNTP